MTAQDQRENSIKMIGDYLLKGWTMTDLGCSDCDTPLMRSRSGEIVCTFCCQKPVEKPIVLANAAEKSVDQSADSDFQSNIRQKLVKISQDILLCNDYNLIKIMIDTANSLIELIEKSQKI